MNRRTFLKETFTGLPILMLPPALLASCSKDDQVIVPNGKKVIVVGAGISGIAAARKLKENGFEVTILEAQDKVGGRLRTNRSLGLAFDEGASWIHGPRKNPLTTLASEAGANTYFTDDDSLVVYDLNGTAYTDRRITDAEKEFTSALNQISRSGTINQSVEDVFKELYPAKLSDRLWKFMLSAYLEFSIGGDISQISAIHFDDDEEFSGEDVIITNGYDKITDYLAQGLDVRLNTRVNEVNYSGNQVVVSAGGQTLEADYVVVSVPIGVLKRNAITFLPELPAEKKGAISRQQMGLVNKFLLVWDKAFWDTDLQYIGYTPETKGKFNFYLHAGKFSSVNALITFAFGNYATLTENMSDSQVIDEILLSLRTIYGPAVPPPVNMLRTKWGQNINSFGSYSFSTKGANSSDFDVLADPVNNKLFFAGEHTNRAYRGAAHGAYLSGIREADRIIDLL